MATSNKNGHPIKYDKHTEKWHYSDGQIASQPKACPRCGQLPSEDGHDACLGNLPGVTNACCGHGVEDAYIQFENGIEMRFRIMSINRIKL